LTAPASTAWIAASQALRDFMDEYARHDLVVAGGRIRHRARDVIAVGEMVRLA